VISPEEMLAMEDKTVCLNSLYEGVYEYLLGIGVPAGDINRVMWDMGKYHHKTEPYYFTPDFLEPADGAYIDCGVYDGLDIKGYAGWAGNSCGRIYGFEPNAANIPAIESNLGRWDISNCKIIPKAVSDRDTVLRFDDSLGDGARISGDGSVEIAAAAIDGAVGEDEKVAFIKMDIEGAELDALHGAEKTVRRHRPTLAVCIYHRAEDIFTIPDYILSIAPDYRLYIRGFALGNHEMVLYAVPE
jgi:FkbM family methyltransferase